MIRTVPNKKEADKKTEEDIINLQFKLDEAENRLRKLAEIFQPYLIKK